MKLITNSVTVMTCTTVYLDVIFNVSVTHVNNCSGNTRRKGVEMRGGG